HQCGFQINRNCDDVLTTFITDIQTSFDMLSDTDVVFTDYSKAYDTVWHNGLIFRLMSEGIKGPILKVLISFIKSRATKVILKNSESHFKHQMIGVPQGSALSPILYILFTNSYKLRNPKFVKIASFADDIAFWTSPGSKDKFRHKMLQKELNHFSDWSNKWQMFLNAKKCGSMSFSKCDDIKEKYTSESDETTQQTTLWSKYTINGNKLKYHKTERYLGVIFDERLNFKAQIRHVMAKVACQLNRLHYLINAGYDLSPQSLSLLYKALARSSMEYGLIHYLPMDTNNEIQKAQNKFLRLIIPSRLDMPMDQMQMIT
ncbi:MAG: hypothetical protein GY938_07170, partial [Ketobacter sp.]|nr:hypothetical protein [Ketobacter sp.]